MGLLVHCGAYNEVIQTSIIYTTCPLSAVKGSDRGCQVLVRRSFVHTSGKEERNAWMKLIREAVESCPEEEEDYTSESE